MPSTPPSSPAPPVSPRGALGGDALASLSAEARAWPWIEARRIVERFGGKCPQKGYVLFETGYGPSGLPHIGTFGEVVRTTFVRHALEQLTGWPTRLICFSDDRDGLRKVPDNVPNPEQLAPYLGFPLTEVPDPFGSGVSFGEANNARLRHFLDSFGFSYEFVSSTERYCGGAFDEALLRVLSCYEEIMKVMLPTLREERQRTYSPILPISPKSGRVLQVPLLGYDVKRATVRFLDEDGTETERTITGGGCKLQWKPDWGMRWYALGVDYEMSGKDLSPSVQLASRICRILGREPPVSFIYELFLDSDGHKISKSKGNGLSVEEWLAYAPPQSLSWFMFPRPGSARRLHFDVIPRAVDDWADALASWGGLSNAERVDHPLWHLYHGEPPADERASVSFGLLLALAGAVGTPTVAVLSGFVQRLSPGGALSTLDEGLIAHALTYHRDFVAPHQKPRPPTEVERAALAELADTLEALPPTATAEELQNAAYAVGKRHEFPSLRDWFLCCYEVLFGQQSGPRLGSFFFLYGRAESVALIRSAAVG